MENKLKLNDDKSEFIIFGSRHALSKVTTCQIRVGQLLIPKSSSVQNIGATFDCTLRNTDQVNKVCKSAWFRLYRIGKIRKYLSVNQAKTVIHTLVTSTIDCNNGLLLGAPQSLIAKLQLVQNAAARLITHSKKSDHVTPLLCSLHWLPISKRIIFKVLLLVYKSLHGEGPRYLLDLLSRNCPTRPLRSSNDSSRLVIPRSRLVTYGDRAFSIQAPRLWNMLPVSIRNANSTGSFKSQLKTHLFKEYHYV